MDILGLFAPRTSVPPADRLERLSEAHSLTRLRMAIQVKEGWHLLGRPGVVKHDFFQHGLIDRTGAMLKCLEYEEMMRLEEG